jgi:Arc/MetJ-type ribon-helix-helix transcriptional regulator
MRKDSRKQAVSVRMSRTDVRHVKQLAKRLGARESDVIRFAVKMMLEKLAPLQDPKVAGARLVPVFMELGAELIGHFELDATQLTAIINDGVEEGRQVEQDDIRLIAMSGKQRSYINFGIDKDVNPEQSVRHYLYEKYFNGDSPVAKGPCVPHEL